MRHPLPAILVLGLALALILAACGDNSSASNSCALNPTLPGCQAVDALGGDADGVDGSVTEACTGNARRCDGAKTQQCIGGAWTDLFTCPVSQQCEDGFCVGGGGCSCSGKVCGDDGCGNSCGTCSAGSTCLSGQCAVQPACNCGAAVCGLDNCGNSCGTCDPGQTCSGGQCSGGSSCSCGGALCGFDNCGNSCGTCQSGWSCAGGTCRENGTNPQGTETCGGIIDCIVNTCYSLPDEQSAICQEACYTAGNGTGQTEFDNYLTCLDECGSDEFCFADYCSPAQAACFFDASGSGSCFGILDCMDFCADNDDSCIFGCYEAATETAQAALLGLNNCLSAACPDASDDTCFYDAIDFVCSDHVFQCQLN